MATAMPLPFEPAATTNEPAQIRRLLGLPPGEPLPDDVIEQMEWSAKNRDNPNPVLRAFARAPLVEEPLPAEIRAELDERREQIRAGRVVPVPHAEIERALEERRSTRKP